MTTRAGWWNHCVALATTVLLVGGAHAGCAPSADDRGAAVAAVTLEGATNHVAIDLGDRHGCVIRSDGNVFCWGDNNAGQTNPSVSSGPPVTSLPSATPVALPGGAKAAELAVGDNFSCARLQDGSVVCWGSNNDHIHPTASTGFMAPTAIPVTVPSDGTATRTARAITAGQRHICILRDNGTVVCHGSNANFKLGRLTSSPTDVVRTNGGLPIGTLPTGTTSSLGEVVKIAAAGSHTCALDVKGQIHCWGLWDGAASSLAMEVFGANPGMIDLAVGGDLAATTSDISSRDHSCSLRYDHIVFCWGNNTEGQLGDGTITRRTIPVVVSLPDLSPLTNVISLAAGDRHTCATTLGNRTFCWGSNNNGQLSRSTGAPTTLTPVLTEPVGGTVGAPLTGVATLAAGKEFTCVTALNSSANDGAVRCWGRNNVGQLGNGSTTGSTAPVTAFTPDNVCSVFFPSPGAYFVWTSPHGGPILDSGHEHTCAFVEQSSCAGSVGTYRRGVLCWGLNDQQQLGANIVAASLGPVFNPLSADVIQLSAGGHHTCAVDTQGRVWCWGANNLGQCGLPGTTPINTPTVVPMTGLPPAVQVTAGADFTCAVLADGTVACWGSNQFGTLGREPYYSWSGPGSPVPPLVQAFGAGSFNATPARVRCGIGCAGCTTLNTVKQVSAAENSACALLADGTIRCWGRNRRANSQNNATRILGCGGDARFCHPTWTLTSGFNATDVLPHAGAPNANFGASFASVSVSMHGNGGCLVRAGGVAQCWGDQDSGRLGNNVTSGLTNLLQNVRFMPAGSVSLADLTDVVAINGGWATKCAVRTNGEVRCWGYNGNGQAGVSSPLAVGVASLVGATSGTLTGVIATSVGQSHACAMTAANKISCWGSSANAHLGSGGSDTILARPIIMPL